MKRFFHFLKPEPAAHPEGVFVTFVVSKDAVVRANARLMGGPVSVLPSQDPYETLHISRPSKAEIEEAGSRALRSIQVAN